MNNLPVTLVWLVAIVYIGVAQEYEEEKPDIEREVTVMMQDNGPLPDADILVLLGAPHPKYVAADFTGEGTWYYSSDGGYAWSELDHHSQIQAPDSFPTQLPGVFEGGIHELGLGQYQEGSDSRVHILRKGNTVYIMNEDFLHIVDMSSHVIASIDYYNGLYCSPRGEHPATPDWSGVLLECFDLYYFNEPTRVHIRVIEDPAHLESGITHILTSNDDLDVDALQPDVEYRLSSPNHKEWVRWEDIDDPGPFILAGIALFKRPIRYDFTTGEHVNVSEGKGPSRRAVLVALSSLLASDIGANFHLHAGDFIIWQYLIWNLSNIHIEEEKQ